MIQRLFIILTFLMLTSAVHAQDDAWKDLGKVKFVMKYDEGSDTYVKRPVFGKTVKNLEGEKFTIQGYLIPLEVTSNYYVLSINPYSSCYFCGNAGLETVIKLNLVGEYADLRMDQLITVEGTLVLNRGDIYELIYILDDAEIIAID